MERDVLIIGCNFIGEVSHEPQTRGAAISEPQIEISIVIPIHDGDTASIVGKVESGYRRRIRETRGNFVCPIRLGTVEENAVPLVAAPGIARTDKLHDGPPGVAIVADGVWQPHVLR
jgi:hypothetical protein